MWHAFVVLFFAATQPEGTAQNDIDSDVVVLKAMHRELRPKLLRHVGLRSFILPENSPRRGHVVATFGPALLQRAGDHVRLHFAADAMPRVGETLITFELGRALHHPHSGQTLGQLAQISGSITVEKVQGDEVYGRIDKIVLELAVGQAALPASTVLADAMDARTTTADEQLGQKLELFRDVPLRLPDCDVLGAVVAVEHEALVAGSQRLAFIDRGSQDKLHLGDVIELLPRRREERKFSEQLGRAVIVATQEHTATCLVLSSSSELEAGDRFVALAKPSKP